MSCSDNYADRRPSALIARVAGHSNPTDFAILASYLMQRQATPHAAARNGVWTIPS
jgi:hypothetical protein